MSEKQNEPSSRQRLTVRHIYLLAVLVVLCVTGTMSYALYQGNHLATSYTSQIDATMMVRLHSALAHLRFERMLAGDREGAWSTLEDHANQAQWCAGAMLNGGVNYEGRIQPVKDPGLRTEVKALETSVSWFRAALQRYHDSSVASPTPKDIYHRLNAEFHDTQQRAAAIEMALRDSMERGLAAFRIVLAFLIVGTALVAVGAAVILLRAHRRRVRDLEIIQTLNKKLEQEMHEHSQAQEHVRQKNDFLSGIIESLTYPFYVIDPDSYRVLLANSSARREGIVEGSTCHALTHGSIEPCVGGECPCPVAAIRESGVPAFTEHIHRDAEGNSKHVEVHAFPIENGQGNLHQVIISVLDITQRKQAEQQQTELLRQLEKVNGELQEFAYVVSHDLKAPLRAIHTLADWIRTDFSDRLPGEGKEQLDLLQNRVQRMQGLIDGILEYSRIGRLEEERVRVDLNEKLAETIDLLAVPDHIEVVVEDELPVLYANPIRIGQVFQNLLSNAVHYLDKPHGRIAVRCAARGGFWHLSVSDNGPGIDAKHFEKIFGMFQTLTPKDNNESTGIGLTLVKKIVETWGGTVSVESTVGQGSTFRFTIPQEPGSVAEAECEMAAVG